MLGKVGRATYSFRDIHVHGEDADILWTRSLSLDVEDGGNSGGGSYLYGHYYSYCLLMILDSPCREW